MLTAWVNGSVPDWDWAGGDAFGARRYCLVVPLMAVGLAVALELASRLARRAPMAVPAAPAERLARDEARAFRHGVEGVAGALAGTRGRALAYDVLSGEYVYEDLRLRFATGLAEDAGVSVAAEVESLKLP